MKLLYISPDDPTPWRAAVRRHLPDAELFVWEKDPLDLSLVDYALVWAPPPGILAQLTTVKAIFNLGAGVDAVLQDDTLPRTVPIVRLVDPRLASGMMEYIVHWVLHFHRDMPRYARQNAAHDWCQQPNANSQTRAIGILGLGALGQTAGQALTLLGFKTIAGWSRTRKKLPGIQSFAGPDELNAFLARTEILVCLLPDTPATRDLLKADTLAKLPAGAVLINAGRGSLIKDADLIQALQSGHMAGAALDVFKTEPLAANHPYWDMDTVFITPHIASLTTADSAVQDMASSIRTLESGGLPDHVVDIQQGY